VSLEVRVGGRRRRVELRKEGDSYRGRIGERKVEAEVLERGPFALLVRIGGRTYDVTVAGGGATMCLDLGNRQVSVEILDPFRSEVGQGLVGEESGRRDVRAAMPGKVVTVKVRVGDEVIRGQGLLVLEAMKMENEVPAPRTGRVARVEVSAGQAVEAGALLVELE
jgi:acetyl/propionyl-CoA carboxylase alpha subunit